MNRKYQLMLLITIVAVGARVGYILYQRHLDNIQAVSKPQPPPLNPDYYVTPKKIYAYDLKSARQELTRQPVWVKVGYSVTYYRYDSSRRHADFSHEAGLLLPLERLEIKDVISDSPPKSQGQHQIMAVFDSEGKSYAFPVGASQGDDYRFFASNMLFIEDPHVLYNLWPADIWISIDKHEVKPGMSELQADFAIGLGSPEEGGDDRKKTMDYANGGNPLAITYTDGKATDIKSAPHT